MSQRSKVSPPRSSDFRLLIGIFSLFIALGFHPALAPAQDISIACISVNANEPFFITLHSGIKQASADLRREIALHVPATPDAAGQIALVEELLKQGTAQYLIIAPADAAQMTPALEKAWKAGVAIMTVAQPLGNGDYEKGDIRFPLTHIGSATPSIASDATAASLEALRQGQQEQIIAQRPFDMGYLAVAFAAAHADGYTSIPKRVVTPDVVITKANMDDPQVAQAVYPTEEMPLAPPLQDFNVLMIVGGQMTPYYAMIRGAKRAGEMYQVPVISSVPEQFDAAVQIPLLKTLVAEKNIKAVVIVPTDKDKLTPALEELHNAGIEVVTVDTFVGDGDYATGAVTFPISYIGSDNVAGGQLACTQLALAAKAGNTKIYIQNGLKGISSTDDRAIGCRAGAAAFGLEVIGEGFAWKGSVEPSLQEAREQTKKILAVNKDIAGIFGTFMVMSQGAGEVVVESGLGGLVEVIAFDTDPAAVAQLHTGIVTQIVGQKMCDMGYFGVLAAVAQARGVQSVPKRWLTGFVLMNKQNMDDPGFARFIYPERE